MCGYAIATGVCVMLACFYVSPAEHVQTCYCRMESTSSHSCGQPALPARSDKIPINLL